MKSFLVWIGNLITASSVGPQKESEVMEVLSFYLGILPFWVVFIHYGFPPIDHASRPLLFLAFIVFMFVSGNLLLELKYFILRLKFKTQPVRISGKF